jgi:trehalose synthase-fused probable maltokinase
MVNDEMAGAGVIDRLLGDEALAEWLAAQRWFASKSRTLSGTEVFDVASISVDPSLMLAIVQARFTTGTHELYQLPLGLRSVGGGDAATGDGLIAAADGAGLVDALAEPPRAAELMARIDAGGQVETRAGCFSFRRADHSSPLPPRGTVRLLDVEQSNSSLVFADRLVLKVYRHLEPGINPELEMLRFLDAHGFEQVAPLHGWYEYESPSLATTMGVAQEYVAEAIDGWELALTEVATAADAFLERLGRLGEVTATLHNTLALDAEDPAFSPVEPSSEWLALLTATIDEEIERMFLRLPPDERLAPIGGRGEEVRERLANRNRIGLTGRLIRTHGDYHLGQTLHSSRGWVVIDFEGEPTRSLSERRRKRSALRDVASMLRSFAYLGAASAALRGHVPSADFEDRAREAFLSAYMGSIDRSLLPAGEAATNSLLSLFELERAIYELNYEIEHRPEWVAIPVAGISRLLEAT